VTPLSYRSNVGGGSKDPQLIDSNLKGETMKIRTISSTFLAAALVVASMSVPVFPQSKNSNAVGDVLFTFVGQARFNPSTRVLSQYGYLTYVNGVSGSEPIFNPGPQDQATALFTFYSDTVVERLTNNGPLQINDRLGTMTIYLDTAPNGDFANPESFRDGLPVQTSEIRLQSITDTLTSSLTVTSVNTITSSDFFHLGFSNFLFGKPGQKFIRTYFGHVNSPGPPLAHIAGVAVGYLKR
jgi:hypothetical protein